MPRIVSRSEWGARPPKNRPTRIATPTPRLWLHHTAVEWHGPKGMRQTQSFHMDSRGWTDIGYSFLVDDDGTIYEGRGAGILGAHTGGDNDESHAISCMGDFTSRPPTLRMLDAIVELAVHGHEVGWWPDQITGGHRQAPGARTSCPGDRLEQRIPDLNRSIAGRLLAPRPPITSTTTTFPEDGMQRIDTQIDLDQEGRGYRDLPVDPMSVVNVVFNTQNPATQGYKPAPDWHRLNIGGLARIVVEEGLPGGRIDCSVWVA